MRRKLLLWLAFGVVVAGLIGVNLALREEDRPPAQHASVAGHPAPERELGVVKMGEPELVHDQTPARAEEPEPPEPEEPPAEGPAAAGCDNPFVPSAPGIWRRYEWHQSDQEAAASLSVRSLIARALPDGEVAVTWRLRITASDDGSELARNEEVTRCRPGESAEEPWFGVTERALGLTLTDEPGRWRWPSRLRRGQEFEGTAVFDPRGSRMRVPEGVSGPQMLHVTREHRVEDRETVEVPAGRFRAWRVTYRERQDFGGHGERGTGTLWVAPDVGLVKSESENSRGVVQTFALTSLGDRGQPH